MHAHFQLPAINMWTTNQSVVKKIVIYSRFSPETSDLNYDSGMFASRKARSSM